MLIFIGSYRAYMSSKSKWTRNMLIGSGMIIGSFLIHAILLKLIFKVDADSDSPFNIFSVGLFLKEILFAAGIVLFAATFMLAGRENKST